MGKRRLVALWSAGFLLLVFACGETLQDDPRTEAGSDDAAADSQSEVGNSESGSDDAGGQDAPTCDANLLPSDPTNCGACGRTCETAVCNEGACEPMSVVFNYSDVAQKNAPVQILLRDGQLYIAESNNVGAGSGVIRCAEPPETKTCDAGRLFFRPDIRGITFFDASVAYAAPFNATYENFDGGVGTFPLDAGGVDAMAKDQTIIDAKSITLLGASTVLVATSEGVKYCNGTCQNLVKVTTAGSSADWIAADANGYCYSGVQGAQRGVYCAAGIADVPELRAVAKTNLSPRIALFGDEVVWADEGVLGSRKRSGVQAPTLFELGTSVVRAVDPIAADESHVIWAHQRALYRCPRSGCTGDPTMLAGIDAGQIGSYTSVALLGKWIYFGEGSLSSKILRIPR